MTIQSKPTIGYVLGGGGALGYAHLGAIAALEEVGIYPDMITGSSMGAIIGVLYANGYTPDEIIKVIEKNHLYQIKKLINIQNALTNSGFSSNKALKNILKSLLPHNNFDSLKIPFYVCVTDLIEGEAVIKHSGDELVEYVTASASIPAVFETATIGDKTFVDGGLVNNMPAQTIADKVDVLIGVDVLPLQKKVSKNNSLEIGLAAVRLMQHRNSIAGRNLCTYLIESKGIELYREYSFDKYREIYQYGYLATKEYLAEHPEMIEQLTRKK